jgi:hypothetical protein
MLSALHASSCGNDPTTSAPLAIGTSTRNSAQSSSFSGQNRTKQKALSLQQRAGSEPGAMGLACQGLWREVFEQKEVTFPLQCSSAPCLHATCTAQADEMLHQQRCLS